jgi:hypothetical protein
MDIAGLSSNDRDSFTIGEVFTEKNKGPDTIFKQLKVRVWRKQWHNSNHL